MNSLERLAEQGDSPVTERVESASGIPSTTEHVKFCGNLGGPPSKPKYSSMTDSEQVPWGKGEKNHNTWSEKNLKLNVYKQLK